MSPASTCCVRGADPLVLEVNSSPGLEGIEGSTGIDVAGEVIEYIAQHDAGRIAAPAKRRQRRK